jgi:hypothetical protein
MRNLIDPLIGEIDQADCGMRVSECFDGIVRLAGSAGSSRVA